MADDGVAATTQMDGVYEPLMVDEEHLLILEGRSTLPVGDKPYELEPGSYVVIPAGQKAGHALVNETD